jgi:hypothetical protein
VELLGALGGGAPLEEEDPVGAARHRLQRPQPHDARRLGDVAGAPVDGARGLLHEQPRPAVPQRAHGVGRQRAVHGRVGRIGGVRVAVVRDDVLLGRPAPQVERAAEPEHVGGDGDVRRGRPQRVALAEVAGEQRVRAEAAPVEHVPGIGLVGIAAGVAISSKPPYSWLQTDVPHAALSAATSPS